MLDSDKCMTVVELFFSMAAWAKDRKTDGKVYMLADPSAKATKVWQFRVEIQLWVEDCSADELV